MNKTTLQFFNNHVIRARYLDFLAIHNYKTFFIIYCKDSDRAALVIHRHEVLIIRKKTYIFRIIATYRK